MKPAGGFISFYCHLEKKSWELTLVTQNIKVKLELTFNLQLLIIVDMYGQIILLELLQKQRRSHLYFQEKPELIIGGITSDPISVLRTSVQLLARESRLVWR